MIDDNCILVHSYFCLVFCPRVGFLNLCTNNKLDIFFPQMSVLCIAGYLVKFLTFNY